MSLRLLPYFVVAAVLPLGAAEAATKTTLHHFSGADGDTPFGALGMDASGALYGAASAFDPKSSCGVVYRLAPPKAGGTLWSRQILHTFAGGLDGCRPIGGVTVSPNGIVYGTTMIDGLLNGTVFSLKPPATGATAWTYRIIWSFKMQSDAGVPWASVKVVRGKLYGTTESDEGLGHYGTVYELTQSKTAPTGWSEKVIATNIGFPHRDVVPDAAGRLFVSSTLPPGILRLTPPDTAGGVWTKEYLFRPPGYNPTQPILGGNGRIWGAVASSFVSNEKGAVYYADPPATAGGAWTVKTIWTFTGGVDGGSPDRLIRVGNTFYGITWSGGAGGAGTVFSLSPPTRAGAAWNLTTLHAFAGGVDGATPSGLVLRDGKLYGTTKSGGTFGKGTVFSITP